MAKTNPCQICDQVPAAEFTLSASWPQVCWFALPDGTPRLVVNICEGCLINAAYERTVQLAEVNARDGALETIETDEPLGALEEVPAGGRTPKSKRPQKDTGVQEVPEAAPAAHD